MEKIKDNKKIIIVLTIIIILQAIFKIYRCSQKEDYYIDEMYSYGLMNYDRAFIFQNEDFKDNWHSKEYFDEYITIDKERMLDFSPVYKNQVEDVHPPFYYLLLRIASLPTAGKFSQWSGLLLNIVISSIEVIVVYFIGKKLFRKDLHAIIMAIIYAFSKFSVENVVFIRMYQLLELNILLLINWHLRNSEEKSVSKKEWIKLGILYITGFLTQYYYILIAIGTYLTYIFKKVKNREYKNILKYHLVAIISACIVTIIFPSWIKHVFLDYRGADSIHSLKLGNMYIFYIYAKAYYKLISTEMFGINLSYILIPSLIIFIIGILIKWIKNFEIVKINGRLNVVKKHVDKKEKINIDILYILVPLILYLTLVIKTAPYIVIRYVISVLVLVMIMIVYILNKGLEYIVKNKKIIIAILIIIMSICVISSIIDDNIEFLYKGNKKYIDEISEKYADIPCIYVYEERLVKNNNFLVDFNLLKNFNNIYILYNKNEEDELYVPERIKEIIKDIDTSKGILIYDYNIDQNTNMIELVDNSKKFSNYKIIEFTSLLGKNIIHLYNE